VVEAGIDWLEKAMGQSTFPSHYPPLCPPDEAEDANGTVYRITRNDPPIAEDFLSLNELGRRLRHPTASALCRQRGLSVFRNLEDARHHLEAFPALGQYIATGELMPTLGKTLPTPTSERPTHTTWWCYEGVKRQAVFVVIEGRDHVAD
jgi:hypothetical protein